MTLDPAGLQVLISRLDGIAAEVGAVLRRAAFSPNIKERADCSAALFTASGELLARAEHIPVHLGSMPASVVAVIEHLGELPPGSQAIVNDPFAGGTHLNDVTIVAPCHHDGRLIGWVANRAHHADVGGTAPGSMPAAARTIDEEGIRLAPTVIDDAVIERFVAASRTGWERRGDLDAQLGANVVGVARLAAVDATQFAEVLDYGERRMRAALVGVPDGRWRVEDALDSAGPAPDQAGPIPVVVTVTVESAEVTVDFTGTARQRPGNVNAPEAVTRSAALFALVSVLDPTMPVNGGSFRPVRVVTEPSTVVAATFPVAVAAGNVEVSQRVADVVLAALAAALPGQVPAGSQGTMNNVLVGGTGASGAEWVYYETLAGGQGGRPPRDGPPKAGMNGVHTNMTNTANTPVESLERHYGLRVRSTRLRAGSGGAGIAPGGDGIEREIEATEPVTVSLIAERHRSRPRGLDGGGDGASGEHWLLPAGDEARAERLPDKCTIELAPGDVVRVRTPGGGGWGTRVDLPTVPDLLERSEFS